MNTYASWYAEIHPYEIGFEVSEKIAAHLALHIATGNAVIVCDAPTKWLTPFRKRWAGVLKILEKERSALPGAKAKEDYSVFLNKVGGVKFLTGVPDARLATTVWLVKPDNFHIVPKGTAAVYVMTDLDMEQLLFWSRQMEDGGVLLIFRRQSLKDCVGI